MDITYANSRIRKICTSEKIARKELGAVGAKILSGRLKQISEVQNLEYLRFFPGNWHELIGDRWGQLAADLRGLSRLIFEPNHDPRPLKPDGGLDWKRITAVEIIEIVDYH